MGVNFCAEARAPSHDAAGRQIQSRYTLTCPAGRCLKVAIATYMPPLVRIWGTHESVSHDLGAAFSELYLCRRFSCLGDWLTGRRSQFQMANSYVWNKLDVFYTIPLVIHLRKRFSIVRPRTSARADNAQISQAALLSACIPTSVAHLMLA